jgi:hypothetical protein
MKITKIELKIIFDSLNDIITENLSREQGFVEFHDSETVFLHKLEFTFRFALDIC